MRGSETRVEVDAAAPTPPRAGGALAGAPGTTTTARRPGGLERDEAAGVARESCASANDDDTPLHRRAAAGRAPDHGRKGSFSAVAPAASRGLKASALHATPRDPNRVLKNKHLRKFRAFAQAYIEFSSNRWQMLEMGRAPMVSQSKARLAEVGVGAALLSVGKPWWILPPTSLLVRSWELFMIIPILYTASITPYRVFFEESTGPAWLAMENFIYATFVSDLLLNFLFGYSNPDGSIVTAPLKIAYHYVNSPWFWMDLVACLPIDYMTDNHGNGSANELSRLARLPRALRLMRLFRLAKLAKVSNSKTFRFMKSLDVHPAFMRLFRSLFWALLALHIFAGIWFMIADQELASDPDALTWLSFDGMAGAPVHSQYIASVYFMLSTFTQLGIGDIKPRTDSERLFAMLCIMFGMIWGATVISDIMAVMNEMDRSTHEEKERKRQLQTFFIKAKLPRSLKQRCFNFIDHSDDTDTHRVSHYNQQRILDALSPGLRLEVVLHTNSALLSRLPSLARQIPEVQAWIVERLRRRIALPGEFLAVENTAADIMFFLVKGKVKLTCGGDDICMYGPGSYFGDIDVLFTPLRIASVQALTTCELFMLSRETLHQACLEFPAFGVSLRRVAVKRLRRYGDALPEPLLEEGFLRSIEEHLADLQREVQVGMSRLSMGFSGRALPITTPAATSSLLFGGSGGILGGAGLGSGDALYHRHLSSQQPAALAGASSAPYSPGLGGGAGVGGAAAIFGVRAPIGGLGSPIGGPPMVGELHALPSHHHHAASLLLGGPSSHLAEPAYSSSSSEAVAALLPVPDGGGVGGDPHRLVPSPDPPCRPTREPSAVAVGSVQRRAALSHASADAGAAAYPELVGDSHPAAHTPRAAAGGATATSQQARGGQGGLPPTDPSGRCAVNAFGRPVRSRHDAPTSQQSASSRSLARPPIEGVTVVDVDDAAAGGRGDEGRVRAACAPPPPAALSAAGCAPVPSSSAGGSGGGGAGSGVPGELAALQQPPRSISSVVGVADEPRSTAAGSTLAAPPSARAPPPLAGGPHGERLAAQEGGGSRAHTEPALGALEATQSRSASHLGAVGGAASRGVAGSSISSESRPLLGPPQSSSPAVDPAPPPPLLLNPRGARGLVESSSPTASGADGFQALPTGSDAFWRVVELRERSASARRQWALEGSGAGGPAGDGARAGAAAHAAAPKAGGGLGQVLASPFKSFKRARPPAAAGPPEPAAAAAAVRGGGAGSSASVAPSPSDASRGVGSSPATV